MITRNDIQQITGADVYGPDDTKIGTVGDVYLDNKSGEPEWVTVKTGLFGTKQSFIPLDGASFTGNRLDVPFGKDQVKDAPRIDADGDLSPQAEDELYAYYGSSAIGGRETTTTAADRDTRRDYRGDDSTGRSTDDAMTRSEERLVAGTRTEEAGKARLRSTLSPSSSRSPFRSPAKRSASSASPSPTRTPDGPPTGRPSPRTSTR